MSGKINKFFLVPISLSIIMPVSFVVSCGSSNSNDETYLNETKALKDFFKKNENSLTPKNTQIDIKNVVNITYWKNFDDFQNKLNEYFVCSARFIDELKANNLAIFKKIKRLVIQPKETSKNLIAIFYLESASTDRNVAWLEIPDALTTPFNYPNKISISSSWATERFNNADEFNNAWKKINNNPDIPTLKTVLKKAFGFDDNTLDKITNNWKDNFEIQKNSSYQIYLEITTTGINNGYIFEKQNSDNTIPLQFSITSNSLVQ